MSDRASSPRSAPGGPGGNPAAGRRLALILCLAPALASAEEASLQEQAQNPIADVVSVPLQNNVNYNSGDLERTGYTLKIQPVMPVTLDADWNLINRVIAPVMAQPKRFEGDESEFGLGDLTLQFFFSPSKPVVSETFGSVSWGVGPNVLLPSATSGRLGSEKWGAGPALVAFASKGSWTYGALLTQTWSFAGDSSREEVNLLTVQPILNYNLSDGWSLGSSPIVTADFEEADSDVWTVPVGGGVSKLTRIGGAPVRFQLRGYHNVARPNGASDWQAQFEVRLLFPK